MAGLSWYFIVLFNPLNRSSHLPSIPLSVISVVRLHFLMTYLFGFVGFFFFFFWLCQVLVMVHGI